MNFINDLHHLIITLFQLLGGIFSSILQKIFRFLDFFQHLNGPTLRETAQRTFQQRLHGLSAEMAYHATLSLFPGLLALITAIGLFQDLQSTFISLARLLSFVIPNEVYHFIKGMITQITLTGTSQVFSLSFFLALWAFSGGISAAMAALDQIHQIPFKKRRPFFHSKLVALGLSIGSILLLILACFFVFLSDLVIQAIARQSCLIESLKLCDVTQVKDCLTPLPSCPLESQLLSLWSRWNWPLTLGIVSLNFAFIYRYGVSQHQRRSPILPGAIIAAILWALLSACFRIYVNNFGNYNLTYGTIATFVILLLWLYLSSFVMLLGAQLNVTVGRVMKR